MLKELAELPEDVRRSLVRSLSRKESLFLHGIAFGAAEDGMQEEDVSLITPGLLAVILEDVASDFRDTVTSLCVLNHSAQKLGADLRDVWQALRQYASAETAEFIEGWFQVGCKDIKVMGYEEGLTKDGRLRYYPLGRAKRRR